MPSEPVLPREELKDHLETMEGHVRQMTGKVTQALDDHLDQMREDRASFRAELREELSGMREELTSFKSEVGSGLGEVREDRASSGDRIGEAFDRVRRDVTRALWIWCAVLILYITAITLLALHLVG